MAGIDVVLHQIIPGLSQHMHVNSAYGGMADPEFFDYVLAKLAASHAQIQPRMKGRAMCEVFGAYGWAEGTPMMKYLIDHLLVRGINYFVPHAFSPKYPDPDCPPHFNANGHNPQFSSFARLMHYTNQVSHLLSDARPVVDAAILYHAEAEWSGMPYMLVQKPARRLYEAQIDYHILPIDAILEQGCVEQGALAIGDMRYSVLIVPYAAYLPKPFLRKLEALDAQGLRILFVDGKAEGAGDMGRTIPLEALVQTMKQYGLTDGTLPHDFPLLRCAHWVREGLHIWMLVNESKTDAFDGEIQ
ncbi:MAG: glycosyl hydrolase, partial [Clostridia bacterium]